MSQVLGIGGVFLQADDPARLKDWYAAHFEMEFLEWEPGRVYGLEFLHTLPDGQKGSTIFSIQKTKEPLGVAARSAVLNWRVDDLDACLTRLKGSHLKVEGPEDTDYGRFAWTTDPEGNRLELYQPLMEPGSF